MIFALDTPIEGDALRQFEAILSLPGIVVGAAFPDLHPGRGVPVGAAFRSQNVIYPHLIGNDIGCGIALFRLDIKVHKFKVDKILRKLGDHPGEIIQQTALKLDKSQTPEGFRSALGTIGHGNHFIEFLTMEKSFGSFPKDDHVYLMVHCGSRSYGEILWRKIAASHGNQGLTPRSQEGRDYLEQSAFLIEWARYNRVLVARALCEIVRADLNLITDSTHNGIFLESENIFIHRKGATKVEGDSPVMTAGSRGTNSYLVKAVQFDKNLSSIAHGCGRKWQRGDACSRLKERYTVEALKKTPIGSWVLCPDKDTLYEEAPESYKNINTVISDMEKLNLAVPLAKLKPLLNIKP